MRTVRIKDQRIGNREVSLVNQSAAAAFYSECDRRSVVIYAEKQQIKERFQV